MLLNIPPQKTLLRRHLTTKFNALIGPEAEQEKREKMASPAYTPLTTTAKVRVSCRPFLSGSWAASWPSGSTAPGSMPAARAARAAWTRRILQLLLWSCGLLGQSLLSQFSTSFESKEDSAGFFT